MRNMFILTLGCFSVLFSGKNNPEQQKPEQYIARLDDLEEPYKYLTSLDLRKRQIAVHGWFEALDSVATLCSSDPEIMRVYFVLKESRAVATLDKSGPDRLIYNYGSIPELLIVPLFYAKEVDSGSVFFCSDIENYFACTWPIGTRDKSVNLILFKCFDEESTLSKAMILFHEGAHILEGSRNSEKDPLEREIAARELERSIVEQVGGKEFSDLIGEMLKHYARGKREKDFAIDIWTWGAEYFPKFQKVLKLENTSEDEKLDWRCFIRLEVLIKLIDKKKLDPEQRRQAIREIYQKLYKFDVATNL